MTIANSTNNDDGSKRMKTMTAANAPPPPLRVCIIGGGPAAMFFCHSYNQQKKQRRSSVASSSSSTSSAQERPSRPNESGEDGQSFQELDITCFEMKSTPGGIWRLPPSSSSSSSSNDTNNTNINIIIEEEDQVYDELWTNAPAQNWEFYDYTFDEHFGGGAAPTMYLPRRDVNEYIMQRVLKGHSTFFDEYFVCDTKVESVEEILDDDDMDDDINHDDDVVGTRFSVTVRHVPTNIVTTSTFDRCIWAAGENCIGYIPKSLQEMFPDTTTTTTSSSGPDAVLFTSEVGDVDKEIKEETDPITSIHLLHSAETHRIREHCPGRKVLLIGGELSAEDLALQCLKWGACHVDVTARSYGAVSWTSQWPGNKVDVHLYTEIDSVQGNTVTLKYVDSTWLGYERYVQKDDDDDGYDDIILNDIHLAIACTGYEVNLKMLDVALRPKCGIIPRYSAHPNLLVTNDDVDWSKWKMNTNHNAYKITGDIPAGQERMLRSNYNHPDLFRGVFLKNPHMMYLCEHGSEFPLLSLDIHAWLACSYLTNSVPQPSVDVMKEANMDQFLDQLHYPVIRMMSDEAYAKNVNLRSTEYYGESDDDDSSSAGDESDDVDESDDDDEDEEEDEEKTNVKCGSRDLHLLLKDKTVGLDFSEHVNPYDFDLIEYDLYMMRLTCKVMAEGKYPGKCLGNYEGLNEYGLRLMRHNFIDVRGCLNKAEYVKDVEWRTYRDTDDTITKSIKSLYTGTPARPLNKRWIDIKEGRFASIKNGDA